MSDDVPSDSYMDMTAEDGFEFVDARSLSLIPQSGSLLGTQSDGSFNPELVDPALTPMTDTEMDMDGAPEYPPLNQSGLTQPPVQSSDTASPAGQPDSQDQPQASVQTDAAVPQDQSEAMPRRSSQDANGNRSRAQQAPVNQTPTSTNSQGSSRDSQPANTPQSSTETPSSQTASQNTPRTEESGGEHATEQDERDMIRWTPETRHELLLQVAYERRHESMSEAAWHRIARGARGGPWEHASWNGVRLEFSRLMTERFNDYGRSPQARERRERLQAAARAQANGEPSTVTEDQLNPAISDATTETPPPRRRPTARRTVRTNTRGSVQKNSRGRPRGSGRGRGRGGGQGGNDHKPGNDDPPSSAAS